MTKKKGFTLVELLIVVAIIGVLAATMTMSSTDAIDAAGANNVLSNLQSLRTAAMEMYMEDATIASKTSIAMDDSDVISALAGYLGKKSTNSATLGNGAGKYGLVGSSTEWYVVYYLADSDTPGMRTKLYGKAPAADLYGTKTIDTTATDCGFTKTYTTDATEAHAYVALKGR